MLSGLIVASVKMLDYKNNEHSEIKKIPKVSFETLTGNSMELELSKNKALIVSFINTECMFCKAELGLFKIHYKEVSTKFNVYFISVEERGKVREYFDKYNIEDYPAYEVLIDKNHEIDKSFKVKSLPSLFVYNKDGELQKVLKGLSKIEKITALVD